MKQRMQGMLMGILVTVLLIGTVTVFAATPQTIEVIFGGVRTTLFGQEFVVRDDDGLVIEPITYNGRVYIPVDTVLYAMEQNAQWNEATRTLNFGAATQAPNAGQQQGTMLGRDIQAFRLDHTFERLDVGFPLVATIMGVDYVYGFTTNGNTRLGPNQTASIFYNLGGSYTTLIGYFGPCDDSDSGRGGEFVIFGDGRRLDSFNVATGDPLRPFTVNVAGVTQLRIDFVADAPRTPPRTISGNRFAIVNAVLR